MFTSGVLVAQSSIVPEENYDCPVASSILPPPGNQGLRFDSSCRVAYVMPPAMGTIHVISMNKSPFMDFCLEAQQAFDGATLAFETIKKISELLIGALERDDGPLRLMDKLWQTEGQLSRKLSSARRRLSEAKSTLLELQNVWKDLRSSYNACRSKSADSLVLAHPVFASSLTEAWCQEIVSIDGDTCDVLAVQLNHVAQAAAAFLRDHFDPLNQAEQALEQELLTTKAAVREALADWERDKTLVKTLQDGLSKHLLDSATLTRMLSKVAGLEVTAQYSLSWDELIRDYKTRNPFLKEIEFKKPIYTKLHLEHSKDSNRLELQSADQVAFSLKGLKLESLKTKSEAWRHRFEISLPYACRLEKNSINDELNRMASAVTAANAQIEVPVFDRQKANILYKPYLFSFSVVTNRSLALMDEL